MLGCPSMRAHGSFTFALLALLAGCGNEHRDRASPSATVPAAIPPLANSGVPVGIPGAAAKVIALVNPEGKPPYSGPTGTLRGMVRIDGDPPPDTGLTFPDRCRDSAAVYGKLFRVGLDKALADAIVGVTGYDGFVPANDEAYKLTIHNCVPSRRTYVVTYGQRMEVENLDEKDSYSPFLDGLPMRSIMVALPHGSPVKIYPTISTRGQVTHYMLRDQLPSGLVADVLVVNYATHDVTGLDGRYENQGHPRRQGARGRVAVDHRQDRREKGRGDQGGRQHARPHAPLRRQQGQSHRQARRRRGRRSFCLRRRGAGRAEGLGHRGAEAAAEDALTSCPTRSRLPPAPRPAR